MDKTVKLCCVDTTQSSDSPEIFTSLIKGQRGIICVYNPFKKESWEYVKQ